MPVTKSIFLCCFAAVVASIASVGCTNPSADDAVDNMGDEYEDEPVDDATGALTSTVSCEERTDTAYDDGTPYSVQVIEIGGKPTTKATGHAFLKLQAAANRAGVRVSINSGFRTQAEQQHLYHCYVTRSCNKGNLAAKPGYSNHQSGLALDLTTSSWLARNASKYGFVRTVPSEAWHYEYSGADPGGPCTNSPR